MTCHEARSRLHAFCDGSLAEEEFRRVERHVTGCAECRAVRDRLRKLERLLESAGRVPEPPGRFWPDQASRILERANLPEVQAPPRIVRRGIRASWWAPLALTGAAAALLLALALSRSTPLPQEGAPQNDVGKNPLAPLVRPKETTPSPAPEPVPEPAPPPRSEPPALPEIPPEKTVAEALPGQPSHFDQMTDESLAIGLAETPSERVGAFFRAADARIAELRTVLASDPATAEELASAYTILLREGVAVVLGDRDEDLEEMDRARRIARTRAGRNESTLSSLQSQAQGRLKESIQDAVLASRELARR